jgi:hypothetical protein
MDAPMEFLTSGGSGRINRKSEKLFMDETRAPWSAPHFDRTVGIADKA